LLQTLLAGPTQAERTQDIYTVLPQDAQLADAQIADRAITVSLDLPQDFLYTRFDPLTSDMIGDEIIATLAPLDLRGFTILARDREGQWQRLSHFLFEPPAIHKHADTQTTEIASSATSGALRGKAVYLSAGHGWYWSQFYTWRTQRGTTLGIVEDFNNAEVVNQYLLQYLRNAGADVWPVRESDMNPQQIIVTQDSPDYGDAGEWITSTSSGYSGPYRSAAVSSAATATATWIFTPEVSARYAVYAWYRPGDNRAPDAQYLVQHAGGTSEARVNQTIHGATWRYVGTYPFAANQPARITLTNQSAYADRVVIADAIRVGGGMGSLPGDTPAGSTPSNQPRWEEAARYWAKYQGAPPTVYDPVKGSCSYGLTDWCDDVTVRPLYAEWEKPVEEDAVFISWHTNGYNGTARGTESYIYDGTYTPGSNRLQYWVHSTLIADIRAGWDPNWTDRGMKRRDLGEVRMLETMPGVLLEIAFHDQAEDTNALKDPRFAQLTARAVYRGIVRFFAEKNNTPPVFLPAPPKTLAIRNVAPGTVRLDWLPAPTDSSGPFGDAAIAYRVYTSIDGFGWGNGIAVTDTVYTLTDLLPNQLLFTRVTGVNAGGESFPTPVVGARVGLPASVLIVDGFGRIDRRGAIPQDDSGSLGVNYRIFPDRINSFDYVIQHGTAISLPFDSANRRALGTLPVTLTGYAIVDWIAGEEQSQNDALPPNAPEIALSPQEQIALQHYLDNGGALFISGAEIGYDLSKNNGAAFYAGTLKAIYGGDDADTYSVTATPGGILAGLDTFSFDDGTHGAYDADWPDYFAPTGGAVTALTYANGSNAAALQYDNKCSRLVYFGFPFETIYPAPTRQAVMQRVLNFLGQCITSAPDTAVQSPQDGHYYNRTPSANGTAWGAPDIAAVRLQFIFEMNYWNGADWQAKAAWVTATGTTQWNYTLPALTTDGWYTLAAQAWNTDGLSDTTPVTVLFALDTVSPTTPIPITPTGGITVPGVATAFVYSLAEDANGIGGYVITVDEQPFTITTAGTLVLPIALPDGQHTWRVSAFDYAGNLSAPSEPAQFYTQSQHVYLPVLLKNTP
jgi:N-acetylmuramoyl-L-alanine amidase